MDGEQGRTALHRRSIGRRAVGDEPILQARRLRGAYSALARPYGHAMSPARTVTPRLAKAFGGRASHTNPRLGVIDNADRDSTSHLVDVHNLPAGRGCLGVPFLPGSPTTVLNPQSGAGSPLAADWLYWTASGARVKHSNIRHRCGLGT